MNAGAFRQALALLTAAQTGPLDEAAHPRIDLLRTEIHSAENRGNEALPLLLAAAHRLEPIDARLARDTYLDTLCAALFAGRFASNLGAREVAEAVPEVPQPEAPQKGDVLLEGLAVLFTEGYERAPSTLPLCDPDVRRRNLSLDETLRFSWLAAATAASLWDDASWDVLTRRHLQLVQEAGALGALPLALHTRAVLHLFTGDLAAAASLLEETRSAAAAGNPPTPYGEVGLTAVRVRRSMPKR